MTEYSRVTYGTSTIEMLDGSPVTEEIRALVEKRRREALEWSMRQIEWALTEKVADVLADPKREA